jgi:tRNA pseudouridine38-40 synthase
VRLRLDVGYDGTEFSGWARQPGRRTVQECLESALLMALRLDAVPNLTVAGRTDAGVHARGQVVHVDVPTRAWEDVAGRIVHRLRGLLPQDIRVARVEIAPPHFDARFAAASRRYAYRISDDVGGVDPIRRRDVLWNPRLLDARRMNDAANLLVGEHDFASYCRRREGASTIRRLIEFSWAREADQLLVGRVVADAFCHNMVRSLVGACIAVGEERRPVEWPAQVLAETSRSSAVMVVPPHGLTLEAVTYPPDSELEMRQQLTRARRDEAR